MQQRISYHACIKHKINAEMHKDTRLPIPQKQGYLCIAHAIMAACLYLPETPVTYPPNAGVACSAGRQLCKPLSARSFALCAQTSDVDQRQEQQNASGLGESRAPLQGVKLTSQFAEALPVVNANAA